MRDCVLAAEERAAEVDGDRPVEVHFVQLDDVAASGDTRVREQPVQPAKAIDDGIDERLHLLAIADVGDHSQCLATPCRELIDHGIHLAPFEVADAVTCSFGYEQPGACSTDPRTASGDDDDLSVEPAHHASLALA